MKDVAESCRAVSHAFLDVPFVARGSAADSIELFDTGKFLGQDIDTVIVVTNCFHISSLIHKYYWYATGKDVSRDAIPGGEDFRALHDLSAVDVSTGRFHPYIEFEKQAVA